MKTARPPSPCRPAVRWRRLVAGCCAGGIAATLLGAAPATQAAGGPVGKVAVPPGFRVELVYEVPLAVQGSWVALAVDGRGRLVASDQNGSLYRVEPSPPGQPPSATRVTPIRLKIGKAQGLAAVGDDLYVMVNGQVGSFSSGVYRLIDHDGDDQYDLVRQVRVLAGSGEHGPHGLAAGPDGKSLYFCCGNMTQLPHFERSRVPRVWDDDQLLPRLYSGGAETAELQAPGGFIARLDLEDESLELVSVGYRNPYDLAFNDEGELFAFDSDMEWDIGASWYRPARLCHAVSGSDFGWRSGDAKWPEHYLDSVPAAAHAGPGSPTGLAFGGGTQFPPEYQRLLFVGDWSYGRILAVDLQSRQASYKGSVFQFAGASPMGVTDLAVRPQDGALYFTVGGRQSASALYRIVWDPRNGAASSSPLGSAAAAEAAEAEAVDEEAARKLRGYRRALEGLHLKRAAATKTFPLLGHADPFIRQAARVALEQTPPAEWLPAAAQEKKPLVRCTALAAAARHGEPALEEAWSQMLAETPFAPLNRDERLAWLRSAALGVLRWSPPSPRLRETILSAADAAFPTGDRAVDRELAQLLVRLEAAELTPRLLAWLRQAESREEAIDAVVALSAAGGPWTIDQRRELLQWFVRAGRDSGGMSSFAYVKAARERFLAGFAEAELAALATLVAEPLDEAATTLESSGRPFVKEWTVAEVLDLARAAKAPHDFARGRRLFAAASCSQCHLLAGVGVLLGPDLSGAGRRFAAADLVRAIVEPNHDISDQYRQTIFVVGGRTLSGRISNLGADTVSISTNPLDPKQTVTVRRDDVEDQYPSALSLMPAGLLNTLSADEVVELIVYLQAGGDPLHPLYQAR